MGRYTMHLTDEQYFLAKETDDPLHDAFDRKLTVHPMSRGKPIPSPEIQKLWNELMQSKDGLPLRTIYIHIPFCENYCIFCGFYQNAYKEDIAEQYVEALIKEMELTAREPFTQSRPFQAVYFGGGTPTALTAHSLKKLVSTVKRLFPLANDCEITLEGRIYHFTKEKIEAVLTAGVNRISLGIQSFDTKVRQSLGRKHSKEEVIKALVYLRDLGQATIIIDLIYGLPGQDLKIWEEDIRIFLSLEIDGCDLYQLIIYKDGALEKAVEKGILPKPATLREQADYYLLGVELIEKSHYHRLSLSHWARTTRERSLYNLLSKGQSDCLPFGSGAGGWIKNYFFFVDRNLKSYFESIKLGQKPLSFALKKPEKEPLFRDISYQIELSYCDLRGLSLRYDLDLIALLEPLISQWQKVGLVEFKEGCIYLTKAGEFWAVNLAQIMIDFLQKKFQT